METKRIFDVCLSLIGLAVFFPLLLLIAAAIVLDSRGDVIYQQVRVGRNMVNFKLFKFRTMHCDADKGSLLTIGEHDRRITKIGYWLRKYKLDELPQLLNILKGDMSFVGPRPEVCKYVELYNTQQQRILSVKPGLTDWASIKFIDENELLANTSNPETYYIQHIIPIKIAQNLKYIDHHNLWVDLKIIILTVKCILHH